MSDPILMGAATASPAKFDGRTRVLSFYGRILYYIDVYDNQKRLRSRLGYLRQLYFEAQKIVWLGVHFFRARSDYKIKNLLITGVNMRLTADQKYDLCDKIFAIFQELDNTEFGKLVKTSSLDEKPKNSWDEEYGFFALYWKKQRINFGTDLNTSHHLAEVIRLAKKPIEKALFVLNENKSNIAADYAFQQIDRVEAVYRDIEKDLNTSDIMHALQKFEKKQDEIVKTLSTLLTEQKAIKVELSSKVNKSDLPASNNTFSLENKINNLSADIQNINKIITEINEKGRLKEVEKDKKSKSSHLFKFGNKN